MAAESPKQKAVVARVMHTFKEGELATAGRRVRNPKQAIAIALSEAGASNRQTRQQNQRRAATADVSRAELMRQASARGIAGRSRMTKDELIRALG